MSTATSTHDDHDIQSAVQDELEWTPDVDAAGIGVAVEGGTVALSGEVHTYAERLAAKRAALRVHGVNAVVDNVTVHPRSPWPVTQVDIAKEVQRALHVAGNVPDSVRAEVTDYVVTLTGEVDWDFERQAAERAVRNLRGVYGLHNQITLRARSSSAETRDHIRRALVRNAQVDAERIDITVLGTKVILTGAVQSWAEKKQIERAAWSSPHVSEVDDRVVVRQGQGV